MEPSEAAWELLEEAVDPFFEELQRQMELGLRTGLRGEVRRRVGPAHRANAFADVTVGEIGNHRHPQAESADEEHHRAVVGGHLLEGGVVVWLVPTGWVP